MKKVTNWHKATVFDCESDGLLEEATKYHVLSFKMHGKEIHSIRGDNTKRLKDFFLWHMNNGIPLVAHNAISFDVPLAEKLLGLDLSSLMVVDTLFLSWYLNTSRRMHGLGTFLEDYGVKKPEVEDWENLTYEEYEFRCSEDVKINHLLWEDFKGRLEEMYTLAQEQIDNGSVGGKRMFAGEEIHLDRYVGGSVTDAIDRIISYLMFKADCVALQEKTGWKVDEEYLDKSLAELTSEMDKSRAELESVMPEIPEYRVRKKPAKPFKKDGSLSASGTTWKEINEKLASGEKDEKGTPLVERTEKEGELRVLFGYKPPNANSSDQVKDFLFSKGWVPQTFKYVRDEKAFEEWVASKPKEGAHFSQWNEWKEGRPKDRAIPQISKDGGDGKEICPSVELLAEEVPEIMLYSRYNVIKHRVGVLEGFKSNMRDGKLQARVNGLTNTMRMQHAEIVNLPGTGKMFGEMIRGSLVAGEGRVSVGSDLSSLEDRCKHHFMLPHDPEYVSTMQADDYDPHLSTALFAGLLTQKEFDKAMQGERPDDVLKARQAGKSCNYASVYGAGPPTIARAAGVDNKTGEKLHEGYWKLNWSVKAIAEEQVVVEDSRGQKWLINPINGFCYSLRKEADKFSTLAQGTGAFIFDMWLDKILIEMEDRWGGRTLTAQFHDEHIFVIKDSDKFKAQLEEIIQGAIDGVNDHFMLRRKMGCETQFGQRYSEIH